MPWAKVDDGWWCHPKVMGLPLAARGLWVSALSWSCQQREPVVPVTFLAMVGASDDDALALVDAGLWERATVGYEFHDWADYQVKSLSEKRAEAGRKGGLSRPNASKSEANGQATPKQTEANVDLLEVANGQAGTHPFPSLPIPKDTRGGSKVNGHHPAFDAWWAMYPRKQARLAAAGAYTKATKRGADPALLTERLARQVKLWQRDQTPSDKIPHGATWLNGERYNDEDLARPPAALNLGPNTDVC